MENSKTMNKENDKDHHRSEANLSESSCSHAWDFASEGNPGMVLWSCDYCKAWKYTHNGRVMAIGPVDELAKTNERARIKYHQENEKDHRS